MSEIIENISKEELMKDLSKAALETLSIVLYRSPIKRSEIDYIRGVNSQTILRSLAIRGLIIKKQDTLDERTYIYNPSTELLQFLGIAQKEDMPEYSKVEEEMKTFLQQERGGDGEVSNNTES
jgi:segregation and condensation protein B